MDGLKVGIVGLGEGRAHATVFQKMLPETSVKTLCDIDEKKLRETADQLGVQNTCTSYDQMLADKGIDIVVIATPCDMHESMCIAALEAGKHVIVEVPMANQSLQGVWRIVKLVERTGLKLQMDVPRHYAADSAMRNLVASGELGEVFYAESEYLHDVRGIFTIDGKRTWRDGFGTIPQYTIAGGGPIYAIDMIRWIIGEEFAEVFGYGNRKCAPYRSVNDFEVALFKTTSGAIVRVCGAKALVRKYSEYRAVFGTKGSAETDRRHGTGHDAPHIFVSRESPPRHIEEKMELPPMPVTKEEAEMAGHAGVTFLMDREFIRALRENRQPPVHVYEAARTCAAAICALQSIQTGRVEKIPSFYDRLSE